MFEILKLEKCSNRKFWYKKVDYFVKKVAKIAFNLSDSEKNVWPQAFLLNEFIANFRWIRNQHFQIHNKVL
jgi:hypothetical protein